MKSSAPKSKYSVERVSAQPLSAGKLGLRASVAALLLLGMVWQASQLVVEEVPPPPVSVEPWELQKYCAGVDTLELNKKRGVYAPGVEVKTIGGRRGFFSKYGFKRGEVVVAVPRELLFTYQTAGMQKELLEIWLQFPGTQEIDRLALALLYEAAKPQSKYEGYVCSIPPPSTLGPPVLWSEERLNATCTGKYHALCPWVEIRKKYYDDWWARNYKLVSRLQTVFPKDTLTKRHFMWAAAAVLSRMWNMRQEPTVKFKPDGSQNGDPKYMMVPTADLFNHQRLSGHIQWSTTRTSDDNKPWFEVVTDRDVDPGGEVFISYGEKCNLSLLLEYGFMLEDNPQTCDESDPKPGAREMQKAKVQSSNTKQQGAPSVTGKHGADKETHVERSSTILSRTRLQMDEDDEEREAERKKLKNMNFTNDADLHWGVDGDAERIPKKRVNRIIRRKESIEMMDMGEE